MIKFFRDCFSIGLISVFLFSPSAHAQETGILDQPEGNYITDGGWGSLSLRTGREERRTGSMSFQISAEGANGHSCLLDGKISSTGQIHLEGGLGRDGQCIIKLIPDQNGIDVSIDPISSSCGGFCGARANFTGYYNRIQPVCDKFKVSEAFWSYESSTSADEMKVIEEKVLPILKACGKTITPEDKVKLSQAVALANYHAQDKAACEEALLPYQKMIDGKDAYMDEAYPGEPSIELNWRAISKRMRDISALCKTLK